MTLDELREKLLAFRDARDWEQFHSPKNLAMALSIEAGELLEHFQWISDHESRNLGSENAKRSKIGEELADVFMYTILLADKLQIDLLEAANNKISINDKRYPADLVRGSAKKYSEYRSARKKK